MFLSVEVFCLRHLSPLKAQTVTDKEGSTLASYAYTYNKNGQKTAAQETAKTEDGTTKTTLATYEYDKANRLTKESKTTNTVTKDGETTSGKTDTIAYTYDAVGNRVKKVENGVATQYTYNNLNQLTEETTGDKTITYAYDTNGNLICKGDNTDYESYTYTADNMLASATIHKGNTETVETYTYDGEGNRLRKVVKKKIPVNEDEDGDSDSSGNDNEEGENTNAVEDTQSVENEIVYEEQLVEDTWYVTDTTTGYSQVLMELDADKNVKVSYTRGDGLISRTGNEESQYYIADGHGDIRFLTDEEGKITDTYSYTSYGELTDKTGNTDNPYLYTGEYYDENTGFYYLRARYMNPETGSFISLDTYQGNAYDPASLHKYNYAQNNPQMYNDPSGHFIGLIQAGVSTACTEVLRHRNAIAVMGLVSGVINSTLTALTGGSYSDILISFGVGTLAGMGMAAAYVGTFAIAAMIKAFDAVTILHGIFGAVCSVQSALNLAVAITCIVDGNARYAVSHMLIAVLSLCGAAAELNFAGVLTFTGKKGSFSVEVNGGEVNQGSKTYQTGKDGELELANMFGGKAQAYFKTSKGGRYVDQLADGIAHESKVGYTSLTRRIKMQILKDMELIDTGQIDGAHWHFFTSGVTGKGGASKPLLEFLYQNGISFTIH